MKKSSLWLKIILLFICIITVFITIIMSIFAYWRSTEERSAAQINMQEVLSFSGKSISDYLAQIEDRFFSIAIAEKIYLEQNNNDFIYKKAVFGIIDDMRLSTKNIMGVYYVDDKGNEFSCGETVSSLYERRTLLEECLENEIFKENKRLWRFCTYEGRNNKIVICRKVINVGNDLSMTDLGTMLVFVDADSVSEEYLLDYTQDKLLVFVDSYGVISLASDIDAIGSNYDDILSDDMLQYGKKRYNTETQELTIAGWKNVYCAERLWEVRDIQYTIVIYILILLLGVATILVFNYYTSKHIRRPVSELISYIRVCDDGNVDILEGMYSIDEISYIKTAFESLTQKLRDNAEVQYKSQLMLKDATIKSYERQMNPHFLFNTLNMLKMMNAVGDKDELNKAITCLGKLLRFNLDDRYEVTFHDEVDNAINYFNILQFRFKDRFEYKIVIPDEIYDYHTIKFFLQPIVENAVSHGFKDKEGVCEIVITAICMNDEVAFIIKDNGTGISKEKLEEIKKNLEFGKTNLSKSGYGMLNVHKRIQMIYGNDFGLDIFSKEGVGTQVIVHLPISKAPHKEFEDV